MGFRLHPNSLQTVKFAFSAAIYRSVPPDINGLRTRDMDLSERLQHSEHVIGQPSGADLVLFHMETGSYYSLNDLGGRIWELCDGQRPLSAVVATLEAEYDAPGQQIQDDCRALIAELLENSLLVGGSNDHGTSG